MPIELGDVRRSQVITTHGPGAIIDFRAGKFGGAAISVVAAGLEEWDHWAPPPGIGNPQSVFEPRLQQKLGVDGFRLPPVAPQTRPGVYAPKAGKLVGVRFPQWLQCISCHIIRPADKWTEDAGDPALYCKPCSDKAGGKNRKHVVPVRFIVMCDRGHLDEFPWYGWVPHAQGCSESKDLRLAGSATAGLAGLILTCLECGRSRPMEGCFGPHVVEQCRGRRPWLGSGAHEANCEGQPRVAQRGASNLYFSVIESALDIPPWSDELQKKLGMRWATLERAEGAADRRALIKAFRLVEITGISADELAAKIEDRITRLQMPDRNLRWEEYRQFVEHQAPFGENTEFEIRPAKAPPELARWVKSVVRATRLREVRALRGFTRVLPPSLGDEERVAKISVHKQEWLPAVENRGEGIFIELRLDRAQEWEARPAVKEHAHKVQESYRRDWHERGREGEPPREVTPRLLLVHSLAHALIRQLSLSCGYSSASLRERLYVDTGDWEMAGLLIFTSSPDADGTLGGLVRQGEPSNIVAAFEDCLASMRWCASDPLCIEGAHSMTHAANGAACHACLLASETSCEEFNSFLDRAMLVGTPTQPELGYFQDFLSELGG